MEEHSQFARFLSVNMQMIMSFGNVRKLDMPDSFLKKELCSWLCVVSQAPASKQQLISPPSLEAMEFALQSLLMETQLYQHILRLVYLCVWVYFWWGLHCRIFNSFWVSKPIQNPWRLLKWQLSLCYSLQSMSPLTWHLKMLPSYLFSSSRAHFSMSRGRKDAAWPLTCVPLSQDIKWKRTCINRNHFGPIRWYFVE